MAEMVIISPQGRCRAHKPLHACATSGDRRGVAAPAAWRYCCGRPIIRLARCIRGDNPALSGHGSRPSLTDTVFHRSFDFVHLSPNKRDPGGLGSRWEAAGRSMLTTINWRHFWISPLARPGIRHNIRRHTAKLAMPQSQSNLVGHTSKFSAARDGLRGGRRFISRADGYAPTRL